MHKPKTMSRRTDSLDNLSLPGQCLIFVDESGTHGKPLPNLAGDFECLCGLEMTSDDYALSQRKASTLLQGLLPPGIEEFHTNELVNPPRGHPWRSVSVMERSTIVRHLFACVEEFGTKIYHCFYSGEQMRATPEFLSNERIIRGGPKKAVETVFRNCLVPHLLDQGKETIMVWDSIESAITKMKVESLKRPHASTVCEIIHADSRLVLGLQFADLIAYSFNRTHRIKHRALEASANALDEAILDGMLSLRGRFVDVLSLEDAGSPG